MSRKSRRRLQPPAMSTLREAIHLLRAASTTDVTKALDRMHDNRQPVRELASPGGAARSRVYWVATASRDGCPHARPVDGVVVDATLYFSGGDVRWVRDLRENPRISLHLESAS